jgi:hypothetical protein
MQKILYSLIFLCSLSCSHWAAAQRIHTDNQNAWFSYVGNHAFNDHWGLHLEGVLRRSDWGVKDQQFMFRGGLNYYLNKQVMLTAGYCFVETYPYGEFAAKSSFPEHRIWEQFQYKNQVGSVELVNRLRLEQRFVHSPALQADSTYAAGDAIYTNRFRVLNRISIPFKGKTIEDKSFYLSLYDELFVNFGEKVGMNIFDQNRAYAAIGYKIPKVGRLEAGYMLQTIVKSDGIKVEDNHTLQIGLMANLPFSKAKK